MSHSSRIKPSLTDSTIATYKPPLFIVGLADSLIAQLHGIAVWGTAWLTNTGASSHEMAASTPSQGPFGSQRLKDFTERQHTGL